MLTGSDSVWLKNFTTSHRSTTDGLSNDLHRGRSTAAHAHTAGGLSRKHLLFFFNIYIRGIKFLSGGNTSFRKLTTCGQEVTDVRTCLPSPRSWWSTLLRAPVRSRSCALASSHPASLECSQVGHFARNDGLPFFFLPPAQVSRFLDGSVCRR